jgi:hypothetical protein
MEDAFLEFYDSVSSCMGQGECFSAPFVTTITMWGKLNCAIDDRISFLDDAVANDPSITFPVVKQKKRGRLAKEDPRSPVIFQHADEVVVFGKNVKFFKNGSVQMTGVAFPSEFEMVVNQIIRASLRDNMHVAECRIALVNVHSRARHSVRLSAIQKKMHADSTLSRMVKAEIKLPRSKNRNKDTQRSNGCPTLVLTFVPSEMGFPDVEKTFSIKVWQAGGMMVTGSSDVKQYAAALHIVHRVFTPDMFNDELAQTNRVTKRNYVLQDGYMLDAYLQCSKFNFSV